MEVKAAQNVVPTFFQGPFSIRGCYRSTTRWELELCNCVCYNNYMFYWRVSTQEMKSCFKFDLNQNGLDALIDAMDRWLSLEKSKTCNVMAPISPQTAIMFTRFVSDNGCNESDIFWKFGFRTFFEHEGSQTEVCLLLRDADRTVALRSMIEPIFNFIRSVRKPQPEVVIITSATNIPQEP